MTLQVEKIKGRKTSRNKKVLGYFGRDEVVHRDNLSLNEK